MPTFFVSYPIASIYGQFIQKLREGVVSKPNVDAVKTPKTSIRKGFAYMRILEQIAQKVVESTRETLGYPISITDAKGKIIGCTEAERLGTHHPPSVDVLKKKAPICYGENDVKKLKNVLPGVAVPLSLNGRAVGVLGVVGKPQDLLPYVKLVKGYVELMCREAFHNEMVDLETKMTETFVQYLLQTHHVETADCLERYSKIIGYDFTRDRACIVIEMKGVSEKITAQSDGRFYLQQFKRNVLKQAASTFKNHPSDVMAMLNIEQLIILKSYNENEFLSNQTLEEKSQVFKRFLQRMYGLMAYIAIGDKRPGTEIHESYRHALKALEIGKRKNSDDDVFFYDHWGVTLQLLPLEITNDMKEQLNRIIEPFVRDEQFRELYRTFMTYCEHNLNLSETARHLYIHRNSLIYRLNKMSKLTSLDLSQFEQCLLLYVALKCGVCAK